MSLGTVVFASSLRYCTPCGMRWEKFPFFLKGCKKDSYWHVLQRSGRKLLSEGVLHQLFKQNLMKRIINEATRRAS